MRLCSSILSYLQHEMNEKYFRQLARKTRWITFPRDKFDWRSFRFVFDWVKHSPSVNRLQKIALIDDFHKKNWIPFEIRGKKCQCSKQICVGICGSLNYIHICSNINQYSLVQMMWLILFWKLLMQLEYTFSLDGSGIGIGNGKTQRESNNAVAHNNMLNFTALWKILLLKMIFNWCSVRLCSYNICFLSLNLLITVHIVFCLFFSLSSLLKWKLL